MSLFQDVPGLPSLKAIMEHRHFQVGVHGYNDTLQRGEETHDFDDVLVCYNWLRRATPSSTRSMGSYHLKHQVEDEAQRYIPNGALILAAHMHHLRVDRVPQSPNAAIYLTLSHVRVASADRVPLPAGLRTRVLERDGFRCRRCGHSSDVAPLVIDHVHPVARGGTNVLENLQTLCAPCNAGKRDRPPHPHDLRGLTR